MTGKNHHYRYLLSLTILAVLPEVYFLSKLSVKEIVIVFIVAFFGVIFMIPADIGFTRGGKTNPKKWVWEFSNEATVKLKIFSLPFEEYFFVLVWIPLPIAIWEYIKDVDLTPPIIISVLILAVFTILFAYPQLSKPDH